MMRKDHLIEKLQSLAPFIYDITLSHDMGYEFSAISKKGQIVRNVGMLLDTEDQGQMPDWFSNTADQIELDKLTTYLDDFETILFDDMSEDDLKGLIAEVEDAISK